MEASVVLREHIEEVWPFIKGYMEGAARYTYGRFTADDIKQDLLTKDQQLWIAYKDGAIHGAVVTEILQYPRLRVLAMHFVGGHNVPECKPPVMALIKKFAKDHGCDIIESYGRKGWAKVFEKDGFKQRFMFYELPVEN